MASDHSKGQAQANADATVKISRADWDGLITGTVTLANLILDGAIDIDGSRLELVRFFALLEQPTQTFPIVTR